MSASSSLRRALLSAAALVAGALAVLPATAHAQGAAGVEQQPTASSALARQWDRKLRGMRLTELSRINGGQSGGGTSETHMYLCSDGRLFIDHESSIAIYVDGANASSGGRQSHTGRWRMVSQGEQAAIEVKIDGGEEGYLLVGMDDNGRTFVANRRVYVTPEARARCG